MDFIGKSVKKNFKDFGAFLGIVDSYNSATGFCKILYENGDSEEIDSGEVSRFIFHSIDLGDVSEGNNPKRRRRDEPPPPRDPGKIDCNSVVDDDVSLIENLGFESRLCRNLENNADGNDNVDVDENVGGGLDLNRAVEMDELVENGGVSGFIDLNVSVENDDFGENGVSIGKAEPLEDVDGEEPRKGRGFDLNLGFDFEGENGVSGSMHVDVCLPVGSGEELKTEVIDGVDLNDGDSRVNDGQLEGGGSESVTPILTEDGNSGRRKRRKGVKSLSSPAETVLRRSARRAKAASLAEITASCEMVENEGNDLSGSGITEELEEKPVARNLEMVVVLEAPPSKIELPPSSADLDLEGMSVVDLFSIYSCLRSFSTLLYLSPFELEDFVAALKTRVSNPLIDSIHVSILITLRKHLNVLSNEGCESASTCLRNLNWDLMDEITWPVFMVGYFLIHGSLHKPDFSRNQLKLLFDGGYYEQPENVKIELLRYLCDDVLEVEVIRAELTRRKTMTENNTDVDRAINSGSSRKRKVSQDASGDLHSSEDVYDADGNSDECCLCKMDGNLICCDGCPAAYHSKCVGIVSSLLPDGDWHCPECASSRHSFGRRSQKLCRGAELLGIDPYGRLFFSCFDYLLVSDSYDINSSFNCYHKDELNAVIQLLESSSNTYGSILCAIFQKLAIPTVSSPLESDVKSDDCTKEPDEVVLQANEALQNSHRPLAKRISATKREKKDSMDMQSGSSNLKVKEEDGLQGLSGYSYGNNYKFGRTAASVVEELLHKSSDKVNVGTVKSEEEIISIQSKFIIKKSTKFSWSAIQQLNEEKEKEKCGWCYCCRFFVQDRDCLFSLKNCNVPENCKADIDVCLLERHKKGHLVDIICYMLCMEERLRGLLLGPWLNPQYGEIWRESLLQAPDVSSLKQILLMLECNLHPFVISADWSKHVDTVSTMGSASHFVAKSRANPKNGISKKKGRPVENEPKSASAGSGLSLFWWRGGRTSRSLFNWKVVPRSIALSAARKAGYMKIPDILYSDNPENTKHTKRTKCAAWRAAVEASRSIEQLALQVRELDMFIRWDDIENTQPPFLLDKETTKSLRLFKKAIIRRKSVEGTIVKYLLDFGKRRTMPDVVVTHGAKLEDSDSERKKYWLDESYVPLHLIKIFEERRIVRKASKTKSVVRKSVTEARKVSEKKGFEYLFLRAEMADSLCGHCNKNVPNSEAVSCQLCDGVFHKKHVTKRLEGDTSRCTYTCYGCGGGKKVKNVGSQVKKKLGKLLRAKKLKVGSKAISKAKLKKDGKIGHQYRRMSLRNAKNLPSHEQQNGKMSKTRQQALATKDTHVTPDVTLRRSARTANCVTPESTPESSVLVGAKKRKRNKIIAAVKKTPKTTSLKKKRTVVLQSFWMNGLRLSRKPKDERVTDFKRKNLCVAFQSSGGVSDRPKCSLCLERQFKPTLVYVACDMCEGWFHGDAVGVNRRNIKSLIGFKCHVCLERSAPICPFARNLKNKVATSTQATSKSLDAQASPEAENDGLQEHHSSTEVISDPTESPNRKSEDNMSMELDEKGALEVSDVNLIVP